MLNISHIAFIDLSNLWKLFFLGGGGKYNYVLCSVCRAINASFHSSPSGGEAAQRRKRDGWDRQSQRQTAQVPSAGWSLSPVGESGWQRPCRHWGAVDKQDPTTTTTSSGSTLLFPELQLQGHLCSTENRATTERSTPPWHCILMYRPRETGWATVHLCRQCTLYVLHCEFFYRLQSQQ